VCVGLPDRDYYFDEDKEDKRQLYKEHIAATLGTHSQNKNPSVE
jgi:predicted metalloendopeptidase